MPMIVEHPLTNPAAPLAVSADDVRRAATRIAPYAVRTPVLTAQSAGDSREPFQLFFKCENLQHIGAFKFRGACNALLRLDPAERARGVIAFSSGNHAQAVARAGRLLGCPTTIVMPRDAPPVKMAGTRREGANVVLYDRYTEDRTAITAEIARRDGLTVIPPFDHPDVIAGQGTAAMELFEEVGPLDVLMVCVGGGGLIAGCAVAAHDAAPECAVIGVEPEAGNDVQLSLASGQRVAIDVPRTLADGAQTTQVGTLTFPIIQRHVQSIHTVSDAALVRAMRWFGETLKLIVEPTGCLGAAAALEETLPLGGKRVGVIVSGGNIDLLRYGELLNDPAYR